MVLDQMDDDSNLNSNVATFIYAFKTYYINEIKPNLINEFFNKFIEFLKKDFSYF